MNSTLYDPDEIDELKRRDIRIYLTGLGWQPDPTDRYKKVTYILNGRTVKAFRPTSGIWIARDFDAGVSFSAIDLAFEQVGEGQWRAACNLLRSIIGKSEPVHTTRVVVAHEKPTNKTNRVAPKQSAQSSQGKTTTSPKKSSNDIKAEYETNKTLWQHGDPIPEYLISRRIEKISEKFSKTFRVSNSGSGNLHFPHFYMNEAGRIATGGVELRGPNDKGRYSTGGTNGIWKTQTWPTNGKIVIFETQIDAMSYDIMQPDDNGLMLMSIRAGTEHLAVKMLKIYIEMGKITTVEVATDNDPAGLGYASRILGGLYVSAKDRDPDHSTKYFGGVRAFYRTPMFDQEDWNDALLAKFAQEQKMIPNGSPSRRNSTNRRR